jgi:L-ascorbate metabolism protein UlaG (beta-lactamase superfamily)
MASRDRLLRPFVLISAGAFATFALVGLVPLGRAPAATAQAGTVKMEWLGWSHFRFTSVNGKVVLTNPYITGNADAAVSLDDVNQADIIVVADGHGDEVGDALPIALKTGAKVFGPGRVVRSLIEQGLPAAQNGGGNHGDRFMLDGITIRPVLSIHDNSLQKPSPQIPYGGVAAGFYITFENGWTVYFSGSSAATSDMALWGSMYKPDAMIFHMSATHDPLDVAMSIKLTATDNPNLTTLMPHHHRVTPPAGATAASDVGAALDWMGVSVAITDQVRSQVYEFAK